MNYGVILIIMSLLISCSTKRTFEISQKVDIERFVKKWYVIAGRFTLFEKGAHNPIEHYTWSKNKKRIDIDFSFFKNSFDGDKKTIEQKAWIFDKNTNAHWKVRPFWPLKLDYYIIAHDEKYSWSAVGVNNQKYLWIMAEDWKISDEKLQEIISIVKSKGYSTQEIQRAPQRW